MITSTQNPLVKQIRRLRSSKRHREQAGLFVVEGIQAVVAAVQSDFAVDSLLFAPALLDSEIAAQAIEAARQSGVRVEEVDDAVFESLSERDNPMGIAAVVERRQTALEALAIPPNALFVALDNISDPGNLGTIIRTADAVSANALLLVGHHVDPFHPTVVKASAGTFFSQQIVTIPDIQSLLNWADSHRLAIVATSDQAATCYWTYEYELPMVLLMGAEGGGLSAETMAQTTHNVAIPMSGVADSLNLAIATALMLYEVRRQQENKGR